MGPSVGPNNGPSLGSSLCSGMDFDMWSSMACNISPTSVTWYIPSYYGLLAWMLQCTLPFILIIHDTLIIVVRSCVVAHENKALFHSK